MFTCPICLNEITQNKSILRCGHVVHEECISDYANVLRKKRKVTEPSETLPVKCPYCRVISRIKNKEFKN